MTRSRSGARPPMRFEVCGVPIVVESSLLEVRNRVHVTYAAFEADPIVDQSAVVVSVERRADGIVLSDQRGHSEILADELAAALATLNRLSQLVILGLTEAGTLAMHAAAVVHRGRAVVMAGQSGRGKSTLALGLVSRGLGLLSDELALVPPDAQTVLPYRRSVHVRPGTPELIPAFGFLSERPQVELNGGNKWSLTPEELERETPGALAVQAPLTHVLLLESPENSGPRLEPVGPATALVELARGTPAAGWDLDSVMQRLSLLLASASCARLYRGGLEQSLDLIMSWLEED